MAVGQGQVISWYICTVAAVLFLGLRLGVKWRASIPIAIEDGFLVLAAGCLIGDLAIQQHMWNLGMAEIPKASRANFIGIMQMIIPGSILYVTSIWAIKVALVIFYKRIAARTRLQMVYNVVLGWLAITWLVIFFHIIFNCFPQRRRWTLDPAEKCSAKASEINYWITITTNISSDVLIISLPISMVMKLKMPLKQKLGVAAMFALGFFVLIASIIRAYYSKLNETMLTCTVSMVETSVAIIAASLPALRILIMKKGSRTGTSSAGRHYELSSRRPGNGTLGTQNRDMYNVGGSRKGHDSEDELVKEGASVSSTGNVGNDLPIQDTRGITVSTEFQVYEENFGGEARSKV